MSPTTQRSTERFLAYYLGEALDRLAVKATGEPVISGSQQSIGVPVRHENQTRWLRVAPFDPRRMDLASWRGNAAAAALTGIRKPAMIQRIEWSDGEIQLGAELMTYISDRACAPDWVLERPFAGSPSWWTDLRTSLDSLAAHPLGRQVFEPAEYYAKVLRAAFGPGVDVRVPAWSTQHVDLSWSNITAPNMWILDWESWGDAVTGYSAAALCYKALPVPVIAMQVRDVFADVLDTEAGRYAQLVVIAEMLSIAGDGWISKLIEPLREFANQLLS